MFLAFLVFPLFALRVSEQEIRQAPQVEFINYTGQLSKADSVFGIRYIGVRLARGAKARQLFRYRMKYSLIHAVFPEEKQGFDADIFVVKKMPG